MYRRKMSGKLRKVMFMRLSEMSAIFKSGLYSKFRMTVQRHHFDLTGNSKNHCRSTAHEMRQGQLYCKQALHFSILVLKTNKENCISVLFLTNIAFKAMGTFLSCKEWLLTRWARIAIREQLESWARIAKWDNGRHILNNNNLYCALDTKV